MAEVDRELSHVHEWQYRVEVSGVESEVDFVGHGARVRHRVGTLQHWDGEDAGETIAKSANGVQDEEEVPAEVADDPSESRLNDAQNSEQVVSIAWPLA